MNEVRSIQPEILGKDREGYRIALHNLSSQAITAFLVETTFDHNSQYSEQGGGRGPLIAKGGSHEFRLFCDTSDLASSNGSVPRPAPCAFAKIVANSSLAAKGHPLRPDLIRREDFPSQPHYLPRPLSLGRYQDPELH